MSSESDEKEKTEINSMGIFGKIERWELVKCPEWRGYDAFGIYYEGGEEMSFKIFIPNSLLGLLKDLIL